MRNSKYKFALVLLFLLSPSLALAGQMERFKVRIAIHNMTKLPLQVWVAKELPVDSLIHKNNSYHLHFYAPKAFFGSRNVFDIKPTDTIAPGKYFLFVSNLYVTPNQKILVCVRSVKSRIDDCRGVGVKIKYLHKNYFYRITVMTRNPLKHISKSDSFIEYFEIYDIKKDYARIG